MDYSALLQNTAKKKQSILQQADQADRFSKFVTELQALCAKYDFKDHDDFLAQAAVYQGVTLDELKAMTVVIEAPKPSPEKGAGGVVEGGVSDKRVFFSEEMAKTAKMMADEGKSDESIAAELKCKLDLIKRRRKDNFDFKAPGKKPKNPPAT